MAEPDDMAVEQIVAIRAVLYDISSTLDRINHKAESSQMASMDRKLTGLTFVVSSSLDALVERLDTLDARLARLTCETV